MVKKKRWKAVFQCVICLKQKPFRYWSGGILKLKAKNQLKAGTPSNFVCVVCQLLLEKAFKTGKVKSGKFAERLFLLGVAKPKPRKV